MQNENKFLMEYFGSIIESCDLTADGHCEHVRLCSELLFDKLVQFFPEYHLKKRDKESLSLAAVVHDIGKIAVPDWILQKPGRLTFEEFQIMKNHTRKGKKMFEKFLDGVDEASEDYEQLSCCAEVCMSHHERYDGEGYPEGLKGEEIPIAAQIVGIADAYDVLVSERIYKSAFSKEEAFDMILEGECGVFSPKLLQIFRMSRMELEEIYE
jgi:putative two-component system response regulator